MSDPEWTLSAGAWRATVSPFGASLRRLWVEGPGGPRDILWGYTGTAAKKGGQGDVLMPFPGRVAGGAYPFAGQRQQLARNDKEGPNAIHGFVRGRLWSGEQDGATARFATSIVADGQEGYPFTLDLAVGYELLPSGLACAFVARNAGEAAAPFGAGFHPYVATPGGVEGVELEVPAGKLVEFAGLLPTGRVVDVPAALDFRQPRPVGGMRLNHCLTGLAPGPDGFSRVRVGDVEVWMGDAFSHVVLYTGDALGPDARKAVAVEPMTCATDALNHPEWGLLVLQPGEAVRGTWGIGLRGTGADSTAP
jgi:aldose 1-epimerase